MREPEGGPDAVLWDLDGVIIDSAAQHRESWRQLAEENGLPYTDESFWAHFGRRNADVIPAMFGVTEPGRVAALADRKEAIYRALLAKEAAALPGARELMAALHLAGFRQAIGSSAPMQNLDLIVSLLDLAPYLTAWVSGESVAHGKPAPDLFLAAAERCDVAPARCLVIEDAPAGIQAAHAGGMNALGVRRAGLPDAPGLDTAEHVADTLRDVDVALITHLLGAERSDAGA
jgi:beta-phosphoglucomutase